MKVYVATRTGRKHEARRAQDALRALGHEITQDWTLELPTRVTPEFAERKSVEDLDGVARADAFILIADPGGRGMYVELGYAMAMHAARGTPRIFAVGAADVAVASIFCHHPSVVMVDSVDTAIKEIDGMGGAS